MVMRELGHRGWEVGTAVRSVTLPSLSEANKQSPESSVKTTLYPESQQSERFSFWGSGRDTEGDCLFRQIFIRIIINTIENKMGPLRRV